MSPANEADFLDAVLQERRLERRIRSGRRLVAHEDLLATLAEGVSLFHNLYSLCDNFCLYRLSKTWSVEFSLLEAVSSMIPYVPKLLNNMCC